MTKVIDVTLILVTSLESHIRDKALDALVASMPNAMVVRHDLLEGERVLRRVSRGTTSLERTEIPLEHGCLTCTVRLDVLPTVTRVLDALPEDVIVGLPPSVNADMVLEYLEPQLALRGRALDSVCLALDPAALEDQMWDNRTLWQAGLSSVAEDDRTAGEFLVKEIAFADSSLMLEGLFAHLFETDAPGCQTGGDDFLRGAQLLTELGPHLAVIHPDEDLAPAIYDPQSARRRSTPGNVNVREGGKGGDGEGASAQDRAFTTLELHAERPLHPVRLKDALHGLAEGCVWLRGTLWIGSAPETKMVLGGAGPFVWLESQGKWGAETAHTHIALTSDTNDAYELAELLRACELSDTEILESPNKFDDALRLTDLT
ncbi:GTP-binding protein [Paeniglutamicibacter sp.]|uniref:GTP-binding protein n=1 Tax=Paeniglutamicibacter sp. TaxID=1934391 RepID=UPI0039891FFC